MSDRTGVATTVLVAAAAGLLALSGRIEAEVPGSPVPQSAQTLAVLGLPLLLGARRGLFSLGLWLVLGALGAPVFAGGAGGFDVLLGPSSGYLLGFVLAGGLAGWCSDRHDELAGLYRPSGFMARVGLALIGHAVILACGALFLAPRIGAGEAWSQGVQPFLWGGVVKSALLGLAAPWSQRPSGSQTRPSS
ncbi:MAG: biotin transporter BioY [Acidobacteriota bacterium]